MDIKFKFLSGIVGKDGAQALKKAVKHDSRLESLILPRAIIGWLSFISRYEYEGELPGVENSYIEFTKNEDGTFTGSIAMDDEVHSFEGADVYHIASAISVSIGEGQHEIDLDIKTTVLERLGKGIDALAKAQEVSRTLQKNLEEEELTKAISAIPRGPNVGDGFDYTHALKPEQKSAGYGLQVTPGFDASLGEPKLTAHLLHNGKKIGMAEAFHNPKMGTLEPNYVEIPDEHKNKGLGQSMYEALFAHGYHQGVRTIVGATHSTEASRVHTKLSTKHGMDYKARPHTAERVVAKEPGPFDGKYRGYKYTLKGEIPMDKGVDLPGKTAAPIAQQGPIPPQAPIAKQPKLPRPSQQFKAPSLKIGKTESLKCCNVCDGGQFVNNKFTGCICFRDLAKSIKTTAYSDGYALDFKTDFDKEAYLVLSKYFRG